MSKSLLIKCLVGGALLGLAACSGSDGGGNANNGGGGGGNTPQSQFGATFAAVFATDPNDPAGPIDPQPGDLPPLSLTTDPIDF